MAPGYPLGGLSRGETCAGGHPTSGENLAGRLVRNRDIWVGKESPERGIACDGRAVWTRTQ